MKFYAERSGTALRQLLTDVFVAAWVYAWVALGVKLYHLVDKLAAPGRGLEHAGGGLADNLKGAADKINDVPGVGDAVSAPFNRAADAARSIADAGQEQQQAVHDLAWFLVLMLVTVPLGLVLFVWLPLRIRWMRRAGAAARLRGAPAGRDLLALRALATQPIGRLVRLDPDIAAAWRKGDKKAVESLAALELRSLGLR